MRKLIVSMFISLDGVIEDPMWSMPYWHDEIGTVKHAEMMATDILLIGRKTYEGFAAAWPERTDEDGYADRINSIPKYVISDTLEEASWNGSIIVQSDQIEKTVQQLKQADGQNITVFGSQQVVKRLLELNLVDEFLLIVYPLSLGKGLRLFTDDMAVKLELISSQPFSTGAIALRYAVES